MTVRVSEAEVREIIDVDATLSLTPFITVASLLVDEQVAPGGASTAMLKEIERWLAAHFVAVRDPRETSKGIDSASVSYEAMRMGEGLKGTRYGQQALALDSSGKLTDLNKAKAQFTALNTYVEPGSQSPYV